MGRIIAQSAVAQSHTGDTNATTLATVTIPANAMGANGRVEIRARWAFSGTASGKTVTINFGGSQLVSQAPASTITSDYVNAEVSNRNATNSQHRASMGFFSSAAGGFTNGTLSIDTTAAVDITFVGTLVNAADTVTLESYQVILYPKA
jgi:hypothetical protein